MHVGPLLGSGIRPGLAALHRRDAPAISADLLAGVTVAAYLVPQVLAYAAVAGLPAVAGLWAAVAALAAYAVLGSSRLLSVGPESTTAVMTAIAIAPLAAGDPGRHAVLASALAVLVGVLCLAGRVARLGFLADLLSRPVLVGYLCGIALIMIAGQLGRLTGIHYDGGTFLDDVLGLVRGLERVHLPTLALSVAVLAVLVVVGAFLPRLPGPLLAVLLATAASVVLDLPAHGVSVVGAVPAGLPSFALPAVGAADLAALLLPALGVALVAYSDNVLTGRAFARDGQRIDADQELLALGASNIAAGFLQSFPVSSSGSRTAISAAVGGRSQLASVVTVLVALTVLGVGGPVLAAFPTAALGALVVHAALRLVDRQEFARFARFRRSELLIAVATTAAVLAVGVLAGVLAAVGLSILDLLRRVSRPHDGVLGFVPGLAGMHDVDDHPGATTVPGLVVYRYDAPLCFANAEDFRTRAVAAVDADPRARWLLLNLEAVVEIDITAADALSGLYDELRSRGVTVALARTKHELLEDLGRLGLRERIGEDRIFPTLPTAVEAYRREAACP
ncbi:STAS domain-containing protein [Pseudonocardia sp. KRD-184]|uniref:STAS domain-containing protein n=1 Tax=Pseudonocardia oceani TaxID=2792013 RepID=A0ABS6UHF6_9PSEU|nr:SulP family inorganic anion transporter [Pseudonocardia oceani]MBW0089901.1 STAS domain-containing protein [Pseudonocardia oceani]MBW0096968.1 STAS domain-containing protein [Pseudonocardia oceani]MBW0109643.1 STAS domain-containing protein [Pseudonocardia oceani]MBW0122501.1 STAS domain-containing protein [Pseudonocardia oceani]MBW0131679.1 STAS domain-containing protein [Pseudonocardia oceani]